MDIPGRSVPLNPGDWPQDSLIIPENTGMMRLDRNNVEIVRREAYGLAGKVAIGTFGTIIPYSIQIGQAGDFWMNSFSMFVALPDAAGDNPYNYQPFARVTMTDSRSGYEFFRPFTWLGFCEGNGIAGIVGTKTAVPFNQPVFAPMTRSNLPTPYCFARNSSILFTFNAPIASDAFTVWIMLDGWLEYEYASG